MSRPDYPKGCPGAVDASYCSGLIKTDGATGESQPTYSKAPIIRTEHWAVLAAHSMYCRNGISTGTTGTYNRNFRLPLVENMLLLGWI